MRRNALIRESTAKIRKWRGSTIFYTTICTSHKITKEISIHIIVLCGLIMNQLQIYPASLYHAH